MAPSDYLPAFFRAIRNAAPPFVRRISDVRIGGGAQPGQTAATSGVKGQLGVTRPANNYYPLLLTDTDLVDGVSGGRDV